MKAYSKGLIFLLLFGGLCFVCVSCATRIDGSLVADGSASLSVTMSLEQQTTFLIQRLSAAGGQSGGQVLDGPAIGRSMSNAPGIARVSFTNTGPSALKGDIQISNINNFLAGRDAGSFITFEQGRNGGRCEIRINLDNGPAILAMLSPEIVLYLNALMAPLESGEVMTKTEYLELVASFNKGVSNEIASSRVRASIDFPGPITSVRGGTFSGRRADFDIPLVDLLVLETPLSFDVLWN